MIKLLLLLTLLHYFPACAHNHNLHLIDSDQETGFALYRSARPNGASDIKKICDMGITEVMVLNGDAAKYEEKYQAICPTLKIIYNEEQAERAPVSSTFLDFFDQWITESINDGKKILFRCRIGCHRTGRLAAYYQMKYQNISLADAKVILHAYGKWMWFYPELDHQVDALYDFINERPCSTAKKYCVRL